MRLLASHDLERSSVVANSMMNRERGLVGGNSYVKDVGIHPLEFLTQRLASEHHVAWLDLCCGTGKALIEAAHRFHQKALDSRVSILGIDLVDMFFPYPTQAGCLKLKACSLNDWDNRQPYDLITCVHGLHYIGDKLQVIQRVASWLKAGGLFTANLDPANLRFQDGQPAGQQLVADLRKNGFAFDRKKRIPTFHGGKSVKLGFEYLGADDQAGPNYTGQPAVNSYYRKV